LIDKNMIKVQLKKMK